MKTCADGGALKKPIDFGNVFEFVEQAGCEIFKEVSTGGRFGKQGDAKCFYFDI